MSHCVPDWDGNGGELDAVLPSTDFSLPVKGKWESLPHKRSQLSDLAFVPILDAGESEWTDEGHIVGMQGQGTKGNKSLWQQANFQSTWSTGQESEDAVTPVKPISSSSPGKEPGLAVNEPTVDAHHASTLNLQEDEMVSWLQYPLDDSLERNYCSDFFGELPNSNISNMQIMKDSFGGQNPVGGRSGRNQGLLNVGNNSINSRVSSADAAMAMGAGRAAGLLPQTGVEAFTKVRTTMQPYGGKWSPSANQSNASKSLGVAPSSQEPSPSRAPSVSGNVSAPMLPPKTQVHNFQPPRTSGPMNFSHFSRPAAVMKANLQCLGMTHGVTPHSSGANTRLKSPLYGGKALVDASTSSGSSIAESTTTRQRSGVYRDENEGHVEGSEAQQSLGTESSWHSMQNSLPGKGVDVVNSSVDGVDCDSKAGIAEADNCRNSSITDSAVLGTEKHQSQGTDVQEAPEPTITSSSGGSGNSAERGKEAASSGKRRTREGEESECQSEVSNLLQPQVSQVGAVAHRDGDDEAQLKKPQQRGSTTKRSRAAEVHNLSERRRRDRINEKMKALQELIPNSNKTDKASMLDEAIEYLKMLQLQLQMMSMRSGMSIPSMVMPGGMQHLQIPQLPQMGPMPPMGMGMGIGMGMGMGPMGMGMSMMDLGGGAPGRPMMPLPSHSGPSHSHNVSATSPAVSMVDTHDHRLQNPSVMESLNVYLAQQHRQMQMSPQPMNMDAFNAYMMHQHQQQQQQQHQLQHQHPQTLHHLPSSMGGGAP